MAARGWGARLLSEQAPDGLWDGGVYRPGWVDERRPFFDAWTATHFSLQQLRDVGVLPEDPRARAAIARVREQVRWGDRPYFAGESEPCINGIALAVGAYFGEDAAPIVETLAQSRMPDGGWNCAREDGGRTSSLHSTIAVLEGLQAWREAGHADERTSTLQRDAEEYLLDRRLLWRRSDGTLIDPRWSMPSYPTRWYYDVLWALDHFRRSRPDGDPRCADAVAVLRERQRPDGRWNLALVHEGPTLFAMEGEEEGAPSRWVTLRALRVLRWWERVAS